MLLRYRACLVGLGHSFLWEITLPTIRWGGLIVLIPKGGWRTSYRPLHLWQFWCPSHDKKLDLVQGFDKNSVPFYTAIEFFVGSFCLLRALRARECARRGTTPEQSLHPLAEFDTTDN